MMKPSSPGVASLFASDYSLSPNPSPPIGRSPSPNPSLGSLRIGLRQPPVPEDIMLQPIATRPTGNAAPLPVIFPTPQSATIKASPGADPLHHYQTTSPTNSMGDRYTSAHPRSTSGRYNRKANTVQEVAEAEEERDQVQVLLHSQVQPLDLSDPSLEDVKRLSSGYRDCESCMEGESDESFFQRRVVC